MDFSNKFTAGCHAHSPLGLWACLIAGLTSIAGATPNLVAFKYIYREHLEWLGVSLYRD